MVSRVTSTTSGKALSETPEEAADSICAALYFLQREAEAAGLFEVGELIQQAAAKAKWRNAPASASAPPARPIELLDVCRAIARLPPEHRKALIFRKIYGRFWQEIANDCSVSVPTAKSRVMEGFQLVLASLRSKSN